MATIVASPADRKAAERKFYSRMAIFLVAIMFIGFAPSFYLKGIVPSYPRPNPTLPPSVIFHGLLFTMWMALLIIQTQLIATRRTEVHMKLGTAAMLLAIALLPVMYLASVWQVERQNQPPFTDPLNWTAIPLAAIPAFAFLVYQAWRRRREAQWHKRLMMGAAILIVFGPGFGRIPLAPPTFWGFFGQLMLGLLVLYAPMFVWDRKTQGKVHPATWTGFLVGAATAIVPMALIYTNSWAPIAARLPGVNG